MIEQAGAAIFLAVFLERFIEPVFSSIDGIKEYKGLIALVLGVVIALVTGVDMLTPILSSMGGTMPVQYVGTIMTGFVIGSGSSAAHDFIGAYISKK